MSKKNDIKNLADVYDNMMLNEAVRSTESNEPIKPLTPEEKAFGERAKANGKNWTDAQTRLMFRRYNELKAQRGNNSSTTQTQPSQQPQPTQQAQPSQLGGTIGSQSNTVGNVANTVKPTQPVQPTQGNDDEGWEEIETTVERIPNATQTYTTPSSNQAQRQPSQLGGTISSQSNTVGRVANTVKPTQPAQPVQSDETTVERIPITSTITPIAAGDDEFEQNDEDESDDEGYEEVETSVERIPNASTSTSIAAGDDEITPYHKKIQEKNNISKFLKHLSEKNYASAHKYLKAVLDQKVKNNILKGISKI